MVKEFNTIKLRSAIYCRVSTDEQVKGYSLDGQEIACMRYLKDNGHELYKVYVDDGYTAKNTKRPALQQMIEDIKQKKVQFVVVWNSDRLTRSTIDGLTLVTTLFQPNSVGFASVTEDIDTSTPDGMMMFTIRLSLAQREREKIAERVTLGQSNKARTGRRVSLSSIYGYDTIEGKLYVNDVEATVVRLIFEYYVYKGYGLEKIANTLNNNKIPSKRETVWYGSAIKRVILNITYTGMNSWKPQNAERIINKGEHEAILSTELFELAQTQFKRRGSLEMSRSSYPYPFSTIMKCGECGASYTANHTMQYGSGKRYVHYRCMNKRPGLCNASDISEMKFEKMFFDYFENEMLFEEKSYIPPLTKDEIKSFEKEKSRLDKEIKKLESRKNNLLDDLGDKVITRQDYTGKVEEINRNLSNLRQQLELIQPPEVAVTKSPEEMIGQVRNIANNWRGMPSEDKKFVIQLIIKKIVIKKDPDWRIVEIDPA
jgi:site-specific DNA recombinase